MNALQYVAVSIFFVIASPFLLETSQALVPHRQELLHSRYGHSTSPVRQRLNNPAVLRSSSDPLRHEITNENEGESEDASHSVNVEMNRGIDEDPIDFEPPIFPKSRQETKFLSATLKTNVLFEEAPSKTLKQMVDAFEKVEYPIGTTIMEQGDTDADFMLVLGSGECSICIDGQQLKAPYGTMTKGSMIGELGLLYDSERAATVMAKTNVTAFRLNKDAFSHFMNSLQTKEEKDIKKELRDIDLAIDGISGTSTKYGGDIIRQFKPSPFWLWRRWSGTVLQHAWKAAALNMILSASVIALVRHHFKPTWAIGMIPDSNLPIIQKFLGLSKLWHYLMNITTFILTFFLSQAYGIWREMYRIMRSMQGKFSDIGLLLASTVERDHHGQYTKEGESLLNDVADYSRMYHAFAWARATNKFKIILSKRGISRMLSRGLMTGSQYDIISSLNDGANGPQNACLTWIMIRCLNAMKARTLPNDHAVRDVLFEKVLLMRSCYAQIGDLIAGRIPLAYCHFVQVLVDSFLFLAPFALYVELGIWSIPAVGLLTLFYSGLLDLAKILLDPLDNDGYYKSRVNMDIGVLIRESNASSSQFKYSAEKLPFSTIFWDTR
ncbi:unnamed protein product [Cylindrotheca closterium]|uniref:Cyclic nucleotide-binding domain-containing protein n=1 Tax=Cylindrotheca closterium TaxID=2856 RepID=A0AAD2CG35_9STRA|nr:unnamed protein product [Cylindrotheca closterium]